jgi:sugar lactone lactonase YvrE
LLHKFGPQYWEWQYYYRNYEQLEPHEVGNGRSPLEILLQDPVGIDTDGDGNIYVSDRGRFIWKFEAGEPAVIVAGTGRRGSSRSGILAIDSALGLPEGICVDEDGRIYFADSFNNVVMRVERNGILSRIAGTGKKGMSGDGGPAVAADLRRPFDVRTDSAGNIYIADFGNHRIRKIDADGRITTIAGNGEKGYSGDGEQARQARLNGPYGLIPDDRGGILIADSGNHVIRYVDADGVITTIAGIGEAGYSGDGGAAINARLDTPQSMYLGSDGRVFINDEHNHAIRVIDKNGLIKTIVGTGSAGLAADGTLGSLSPLNDPENIAVLKDGTVLITDGDNGRVWRLGTDLILRHLAGRGSGG